MITSIKHYLDSSTKEIVGYTFELMEQKQKMEELMQSANKSVTQSRDAELVHLTNSSIKSLVTESKTQLKQMELVKKELYFQDMNADLEQRFLTASSEMQLTTRLEDVGAVSVCWTNRGELVAVGKRTIIYNQSLIRTRSIDLANPFSVAAMDNDYVFLSYREPNVMVLSYCLRYGERKIDSYESPRRWQHIAYSQSTNEIISVDCSKKQLRFYQSGGGFIFSVSLKAFVQPYGIHCLPNGNILVSDHARHSVHKFIVVGQTLGPVWSCDMVYKPTGISSDSGGRIYVASLDGDVYVISDSGKIVKRLVCSGLEGAKFWDVSIYGQIIAVAAGDKGPLLFSCKMTS